MRREQLVTRNMAVLVCCCVSALFGTARTLWAQTAGLHVSETSKDKVVRMTVYPAAEPRPALKYQLLPPFIDRIDGNAAVHYGKVTAAAPRFFADGDLQRRISEWAAVPLDELPRDEVRAAVEWKSVLDSLQRGARCTHCDWQLPIREGDTFFSMLLPEAQKSRAFARLLSARARLLIAESQYDEAIETLQTGYALGQHVAEGETLIHGLVGIAISDLTSRQVQTLIQQPDAPNLYWALTVLPSPLIDGKRGIEAEMYSVQLSFPELHDLDDMTRSADHWRDSLRSLWRKVHSLNRNATTRRPEILTLMTLNAYPDARRELIESGYSEEQVDKMPIPQVLLIHTKRRYELLRDDVFKWLWVPYPEAQAGMEQAENQLLRLARKRQELVPLASMFLPAVRAVSGAIARCEREIAVLRTIEALRLYAAGHDGELPEQLDELTVPVPVDPLTGKPFVYERRDTTGIITGPPLPGKVLHLEITMAKR